MTATPESNLELSLVIPCYNEQDVLPSTVPAILKALNSTNSRYELILVNNGSQDRTGERIDELKAQGNIIRVDVFPNEGYGNGILKGAAHAKGRIVGFMGCDGQVAPDDILKVFNEIRFSKKPVLAKIARISRHDGFRRWMITKIFNGLCRILFPIHTNDVNGHPKMLLLTDFKKMEVQSKAWFIDFEIIVKSARLGLELVEIEAPFLRRKGGKSNVRIYTLVEFLKNIFRYRLTGKFE